MTCRLALRRGARKSNHDAGSQIQSVIKDYHSNFLNKLTHAADLWHYFIRYQVHHEQNRFAVNMMPSLARLENIR